MPQAFIAGLDDQVRHKMIDLLNAALADGVALTLAVKQAHWNLKGTGFIGVHKLLDEAAERLREATDTIAERAVILGGTAKGTLEAAGDAARLDPYPLDIEPVEDHVAALTDRYLAYGKTLRDAIEEADEAGDDDTADLFTELSRIVDKDAWYIGANAPRR